jgi:hypothetical protein
MQLLFLSLSYNVLIKTIKLVLYQFYQIHCVFMISSVLHLITKSGTLLHTYIVFIYNRA